MLKIELLLGRLRRSKVNSLTVQILLILIKVIFPKLYRIIKKTILFKMIFSTLHKTNKKTILIKLLFTKLHKINKKVILEKMKT